MNEVYIGHTYVDLTFLKFDAQLYVSSSLFVSFNDAYILYLYVVVYAICTNSWR